MDFLRRYLAQIKTQLSALNVSQKMLIALLALVMVATIFFTVVWSAKPQMVTLVSQPLSPQEISQIEMVLKGKKEYQVSGNQVLVPVEQLGAARGLLYSERAMPRSASAFTELVMAANPFTSEANNVRAFNNARQIELTKMLLNFPYIDDANVIVSVGSQAGLGRSAMPSSASVAVKTRNGEDLTQGQVLAIAQMVAGSLSGMKQESVTIVANGSRTHKVPASDAALPTSLVEFMKVHEDHLLGKLYGLFSSYGDVKIAVTVLPDLSIRHQQDRILDPRNKVVAPESEQIRESQQRDAGGPGADPGVKSNDSVSIAENSAVSRGGSSITTENNTRNKVEFGEQKRIIETPAGVELKRVTASLLFPRSYFVSLYRRQNNDQKAEPDDAKLQPIIDQQLKAAAETAKKAIDIPSDDQIRTDWYDDTLMTQTPELVLAKAGGVGVGGAAGMAPMIAQYAKQGVLAIVALCVLGMMLMMVKRASPAAVSDEGDMGALGAFAGAAGAAARKKKIPGVEQLDAVEDVFGEANQGEAVLTGIELDDETLASRKMVDEVSTMIKDNPENAAALVKRWMTKNN